MPSRIKTFDIALYVIPLIFLAVSLAVIYSLVFDTAQSDLVIRQGISAFLGLAVMVIIGFVDYRFFRGTSWIFYLIALLLLIAVNIFGKTINGAKNWLDFGFFQLQPSEISKAFLILSLSSFYSSRVQKMHWSDFLLSLLIILPPFYLIASEPDFGAILVLAFIYLSILIAAKPSRWQFFILTVVLSAIALIFLLSVFNIGIFGNYLRQYQRERILTFISPNSDPYDSGYNVLQAQIAVGSGGIFGQGLGHGSQSQLQFLPEPHTDFIFAGIAESFGFVGAVVILALYLYLILKVMRISSLAQDNFGMLVTVGTTAMFVFQVIVNVGMNIGVMPITGITLPLLSYGGSSLITSLFLIGLSQSIFIRHKKISF